MYRQTLTGRVLWCYLIGTMSVWHKAIYEFVVNTVGQYWCLLCDCIEKPLFGVFGDAFPVNSSSSLDQTVPNLSSPSQLSPTSHALQAQLGEQFSRKVFVGGLPPDIDEGRFVALTLWRSLLLFGTAIKHPVPDRVKPAVIRNLWHPDTFTLNTEHQEFPDVKNYKWRLNPV